MIRINLLPFRAARKRENVRRQVSISGLMLLLVFLLLLGWFISLSSNVSELKATENNKKVELEGYKKELEEIKKLEAAIKEINSKLDVINTLKKGKTGPVLLLSAIADAVPKEKLWLTSLKESNGVLSLSGTAMDNETVALFMNNLEAAKGTITAVDLKGTKLKEINKLKVSDFTLECKTYAYKPEPKKVDTKKKKGK